MVLKKLLVLKAFFVIHFIQFGFCFSQTQHFVFEDSTGESYGIVVDSIFLNDQILDPKEEDDMGVFTSDGLCVGASILDDPLPLPIIVWKDDPLTTEMDGYTVGDTMHFKFWSSSEEIEKDAVPLYKEGDGTFGYGVYSRLILIVSASAVEDFSEEISYSFNLAQNYPNPFNPETKIGFTVPVACWVEMKIYNVAGRLVKTYQGDYNAGIHSINWDGANMRGENVGSGIYFYRMEAADLIQQKKMILMK